MNANIEFLAGDVSAEESSGIVAGMNLSLRDLLRHPQVRIEPEKSEFDSSDYVAMRVDGALVFLVERYEAPGAVLVIAPFRLTDIRVLLDAILAELDIPESSVVFVKDGD